ncbi:MAG: class I tRNA ligase family protein, partial [Pseudomonadota bacterium]
VALQCLRLFRPAERRDRPEETQALQRHYKTDVLVTGFDIIFFWVARMMMMGLHFMEDEAGAPEVPFHTVYIHALVRDEKGQKMSKSKGNVIDPLELIDSYGADALRFTLTAMAAQGRDIKLAKSRVEGYRNFATKIWNAARFAEMNECVSVDGFDPASATQTINVWIRGETERTAAAVTKAIEEYRFNEAAGAAYDFVWGQFCDWYLELIKPVLNGSDADAIKETRAMVGWTFDQILKLLHPFMPFVTEELWERMADGGASREAMLVLSEWPQLSGLQKPEADAEIGWAVRLISEIRSVRSEMNVPAGARIPLHIIGGDETAQQRLATHGETIKRLARLETIVHGDAAPEGSANLVVDGTDVALPLAGVIDMAAERDRLSKEITKANDEIAKIDNKLSNAKFVERAPAHVVEENRERRAGFEDQVTRLSAALERLQNAA